MAREYRVNGEAMVRVKFAEHVQFLYRFDDDYYTEDTPLYDAQGNFQSVELGLASEGITITPSFYHQDIYSDGFGNRVPAEVVSKAADARIRMTLVHMDQTVLNIALSESTGGGGASVGGTTPFTNDGRQAPSLRPLGNGRVVTISSGAVVLASGCHYMAMEILSRPVTVISGAIVSGGTVGYRTEQPWRFPTCYLAQPPMTTKIGTGHTVTQLEWRAIPYSNIPETTSTGTDYSEIYWDVQVSGAVVWDHSVLRSG